VDQTKN